MDIVSPRYRLRVCPEAISSRGIHKHMIARRIVMSNCSYSRPRPTRIIFDYWSSVVEMEIKGDKGDIRHRVQDQGGRRIECAWNVSECVFHVCRTICPRHFHCFNTISVTSISWPVKTTRCTMSRVESLVFSGEKQSWIISTVVAQAAAAVG